MLKFMEDTFGVHQNLDRQRLRVKSDSGFQVKTLLLGFACSRSSRSAHFVLFLGVSKVTEAKSFSRN